MKKLEKLKLQWKGLFETMVRFPITVALLVASSIVMFIITNQSSDEILYKTFISLMIGSLLSSVLQLAYERFIESKKIRLIFAIITILLSFTYFLILYWSEMNYQVAIRTTILFFVLVILFLWIPSIKSKVTFNESFMAVFKAFFTTVFFAGLLYLGVAIVLLAFNELIVEINYKAYEYAANIIFILFAPMYFLSFIPVYPRNNDPVDEKVEKATTPSKFLENLISYVFIPITAVFTVILLLYIVINIMGDFWKDNLLEPILIIYSIGIILVYLLASRIENKFSKYFKLSIPKILIPVVLFQTLASILKIQEVGITYGRYYVILFGIFATIAGILFCFISVKKNGIIAPILIGLSVISILPPVDAFTISRANQASRLKQVLIKNEMLQEGRIIPNENISTEDKDIIVSTVQYLESSDDVNKIAWLSSYNPNDFEKTFGFSKYNRHTPVTDMYYYFTLIRGEAIPIQDYDYFMRVNLFYSPMNSDLATFTVENRQYSLFYEVVDLDEDKNPEENYLVLKSDDGFDLIKLAIDDIFQKYEKLKDFDRSEITVEEASATWENENVILTYVAEHMNLYRHVTEKKYSADGFFFIKIK